MMHENKATKQGLESNFACNTFGAPHVPVSDAGTYLLTRLLVPVLSQQSGSRVVRLV